jgi:hypothetical protein
MAGDLVLDAPVAGTGASFSVLLPGEHGEDT